jgi:DnaJ-class molecular chaperone
MNKYMDQNHPDAFVDYPLMDAAKSAEYGLTKICPVCAGHGGWNLLLNQYDLNGKENTPANRHLYSHFRSHCMHCNGWGYVRETENCPGHEWKHVRNTGNCLNLYRCEKCGKEWEIDSSG